jgi:hypothetical protein
LATTIAKAFDAVIMFAMRAVASVLPNYGDFNTANFVAYGFDISPGLLAQSALITLAYFVAVTTAAYFFLKTREIAA